MAHKLIHRLLDWLKWRARAADGQGFIVGHRTIAEHLGCSPGALPKLMRQLEQSGCIRRESLGYSQKIYVLSNQPDHLTDLTSDHPSERSLFIDQSTGLLDRLLTWLSWHAQGRSCIAGHRAIAEHLGCSPGALPKLMRQLESSACIRREQIGKYRRIYVTSHVDHQIDHLIDLSDDRSPEIDRPITHDESLTTATYTDVADRYDRSCDRGVVHVGIHDSLGGGGVTRMRVFHSIANKKLFQTLCDNHVTKTVAAQLAEQYPERAPQDFLDDLTNAKNTPRVTSPVGLVVRRWQLGERVPEWSNITQQESSNGSGKPQKQRTTAHQSGRTRSFGIGSEPLYESTWQMPSPERIEENRRKLRAMGRL
ncbi:MAG: hypothetical protein GFH27_549323n12 [Chloroflexi bacterium AL-W]|nr:hypothetical protein [Chloroflexi bacterium AL-N1]NOK70163.1 hypothetical protein [Chloroflexi bacterium AL-N10]NOK77700.1 hypothetical protein [Chloroflexi bacterium AL-N5]NOK84709.1 hypothetical protein [Chloroflexi bacterium AL-W]NOK93228.1 hypothetical protein [Chloroflexi bacterium AL-N15]